MVRLPFRLNLPDAGVTSLIVGTLQCPQGINCAKGFQVIVSGAGKLKRFPYNDMKNNNYST